MKYVIPLAAALLVGLGFSLHHSPVEVPKSTRNVSPAGGSAAPESVSSRVEGPAAEPQPSMSGSASVAPPVRETDLRASRAPKGPAPSRLKILTSLEGALALTELA